MVALTRERREAEQLARDMGERKVYPSMYLRVCAARRPYLHSSPHRASAE
jgi:hypothetical protein